MTVWVAGTCRGVSVEGRRAAPFEMMVAGMRAKR